MMIFRFLATALTALLFSSALAIDLPTHARLTLVSDSGVVLGVGQLADGDLTLTLQGGADGAMKLLIVGADGTILALDATVTEDGTVLIELQGALENLAVSVRNAGGSAVVAYEQPVAARPGSDGAASEVPGGNQAGGEGDAPDGDNGARADENPGNGPNQNAGDNPDENAGDGAPDQGPNENAGDNPNENAGAGGPDEDPEDADDNDPNQGPNEHAGDNPNENAGNDPDQGPNENAGDNPNQGPNENAGDNPNENAGNNPNQGPNENAGNGGPGQP